MELPKVNIKQLLEYKDAHNVPIYSLTTIEELADTMHERLGDYRETEIQTENQMSIAKARVADMQVQFDLVETQQQLYIHTEMETLDAIFSSAITCLPIDIAIAVGRPYQDMVVAQQIWEVRVP